jgi:hypothetical protein
MPNNTDKEIEQTLEMVLTKLSVLDHKITALYEWTQQIDAGIRSVQSGSGMSSMMMRMLVPTGMPPLDNHGSIDR